MRKSGGVWEGQTEDTVMGGSYRSSELQEAPWWGVEDGGLVCVEKDGESDQRAREGGDGGRSTKALGGGKRDSLSVFLIWRMG